MTRLANTEQDAEEGSDEPVGVEAVADDIEAAARELGADLVVTRSVGPRSPTVRAGHGSLQIEVRDTGEGFDLEGVPGDRLGIRASIIARVAAIGGSAAIDTGGSGTRVRLAWSEGAA